MLIRDRARQARAGLSPRKRSDDGLKETRSAAGTIVIAGYVRAPDPAIAPVRPAPACPRGSGAMTG